MDVISAPVRDEDLLAAVCAAGALADVASVTARVNSCLGLELSPSTVEERLDRLRRDGLVRRVLGHVSDRPRFHLTELGVQHLLDLE